MKKSICVLGLGYIGLPTSAMFASHGHKVYGVDLNPEVVKALLKGEVIIEEPYLDILVQAAVTSSNLEASDKPREADVFIIAVPTPITEDKRADLSYVEAGARSIVPYLRSGNIVILESTSPTGTTDEVVVPILEESGLKAGVDFLVGHSPERVLPGQILMELVNNNRIIGGINQASSVAISELYSTFVRGEMYLTDARTAEMTKMMENTFRDVNIALANELAIICEKSGINAWEVIQLANKHPRVNIHQPGPGVGGHCLAVDPWFIVEKAPAEARIIRTAREINDGMPDHVLHNIKRILPKGGTIAILGVTYKPNVDDIRESPIIELLHLLHEDGGFAVRVHDPYVRLGENYHSTVNGAVQGADLVVIAVNHAAYNGISFKGDSPVYDLRNAYDGAEYLIGRGKIH